ncbi:two-component sensor histidine kinase [Caenimonas koreensis DSM 17982]|uniref:histidine kinase n=1 Tax=Caenimonas koreensis DSM 17982 TaxID=1121255 RepID=A0A844B171_9BURK|nr:ATP-binding protein [Caenimonas koreensis]MRD47032.1 two-component sensor histidine kinase [Caenimonas koreensis DSM 17982]
MRHWLMRHGIWIAAWLAATLAGSALLAQAELSRLREAFETDARIAHRLLSQRAVQHEAVLATLALLQPAAASDPAEQRLASVYPQIVAVQRRDGDAQWPDAALLSAETLSLSKRKPVLADSDLARGRYRILLAGQPSSFALTLDVRAAVPWNEWPMPADKSPVRVVLEQSGQRFVLQPGLVEESPWRFDFSKHLAAESQPFELVATRSVGWEALPWLWMLTLAAAAAVVLAVLRSLQRQRAERSRAEELLRLGQVARLNGMGELAAGMAHELNQPLTGVLANTQAAQRLLDEDPPDLSTARWAMEQAVQQGKRASEVVGRMRRAVSRPDAAAQSQSVALQDAVRNAFYLLEPEFTRHQVTPRLTGVSSPVMVHAEPVALEQIIHNLLVNALQALDQVPVAERELAVKVDSGSGAGKLTIADSGPGIPADVLPRVFEPFFTTRENGLGLGLSLCESLASSMGGRLDASHRSPRGAVFRLALPLAKA